MPAASFDRAEQVHAALHAIVSDPEHGPSALGSPHVMANLLSDYLPDAPRESGLLLAAATAGLPDILRGHIGHGMDPVTAVRLTAASLADRTAFTSEACEWVTSEIAWALGIPVAGGIRYPVTAERSMSAGAGAQTADPRPEWVRTHDPRPVAGGPGSPAPGAKSRNRRRLVAGLAVLVVAAGAALIALTHRAHPGPTAQSAPAPDLARFVPGTQRVLRVYHFSLDSGQVPEVAVTTTTGTPRASSTYVPEDVLLLAWDKYARRWTLAYDAARDPVNIANQPDSYTDSFEASYLPVPAALIPKGLGVAGIRLSEIRDQSHGAADLLVTASLLYADGFGQAIGIIHYDGHVARVVWAFVARGGGAAAFGPPGRQEVAVTSIWATASDPQCCPARSYRFVLAKAQEPQVGEYYRVISDDRPWLGAIVTEQPPQSGNSNAVVVSVVPGSPAAGLLRAGDILVGVSGSSARSHGLGPAIFDQLARYKPGQAARLDIYRNGRPLVVGIKLGSLADQKAMNAGVSLPAPNGTVAEYML